MSSTKELSYFEYWLTKDVWPAAHAVRLMVDFFNMSRSWEEHEDYTSTVNKYHNGLINKLGSPDTKDMFRKRNVIVSGYDKNDQYVENKIILEESDILPEKYIKWLYSNGYRLPHEFLEFIGIEEKVPQISQREQDMINKNVCQGIAKTLWEMHPKMTIAEMCDHPAIQRYGFGRYYGFDTTLRRWLSRVDPREKKTGPKK